MRYSPPRLAMPATNDRPFTILNEAKDLARNLLLAKEKSPMAGLIAGRIR